MQKFALFLLFILAAFVCQCQRASLPQAENSEQESATKGVLDDIAGLVYGSYEKIDIPGAYCSNGSPYKIFVQKADSPLDKLLGNHKRLALFLEGGGACWDYASCSGQSGIRGAANPNGIPNNYMNLKAKIDGQGGSINAVYSPLILPNHPSGRNIKTSSWNKVFIPYCTGDVFSGNKVTVYEDPDGIRPPITCRHFGHINLEKVISYLQTQFNRPEEMFVTGYSAGGAGTSINYHFFRKALNPNKANMVNDSGPIFTAPDDSFYQYRLQNTIRAVWNADYLLRKYQEDFPELKNHQDMGLITETIARAYPQDKITFTAFVRDGNYSGYSYARFYGLDEKIPEQKEEVYRMWHEDLKILMKTYDKYSNLYYFIPYFRDVIESHCTTVIEFKGTEIYASGVDVGTFIQQMLSGSRFLRSYYESYNPLDQYTTGFWIELSKLL